MAMVQKQSKAKQSKLLFLIQMIYRLLYGIKYPYLIQINFQTDLFDPEMVPEQVLPSREDLGRMAMKCFTTHLRFSELEPQRQMHFSVIPRTPIFGGEGSYSAGGHVVTLF